MNERLTSTAVPGHGNAMSTTTTHTSSEGSLRRIARFFAALLHSVTTPAHFHAGPYRKYQQSSREYENMLRAEDGFIPARQVRSHGFLRIF